MERPSDGCKNQCVLGLPSQVGVVPGISPVMLGDGHPSSFVDYLPSVDGQHVPSSYFVNSMGVSLKPAHERGAFCRCCFGTSGGQTSHHRLGKSAVRFRRGKRGHIFEVSCTGAHDGPMKDCARRTKRVAHCRLCVCRGLDVLTTSDAGRERASRSELSQRRHDCVLRRVMCYSMQGDLQQAHREASCRASRCSSSVARLARSDRSQSWPRLPLCRHAFVVIIGLCDSEGHSR